MTNGRQFRARPATILVWQAGALGDTMLSYPALRALRIWAPEAMISVIGHHEYLSFAVELGLVDRVESVDGPAASAIFGASATLRSLTFDLAVIWSEAFSDLVPSLHALGVRQVLGNPARAAGHRHQAAYLLGCLVPLGVHGSLRMPRWPARRAAGTHAAADRGGRSPLVLLHPGAGARWKRWPLASFLDLAAALRLRGYAVRWSCGPADEDIHLQLQAGDHAHELLAPMPVRDLAMLLANVDLLVSGDTGIAHLASLCGTRSLTLFGPTDARRWHPLGAEAAVLRARCRCHGTWQSAATVDSPAACSAAGGEHHSLPVGDPVLRRCRAEPGDSCRCLASVPPRAVLDRCDRLLAGTVPA